MITKEDFRSRLKKFGLEANQAIKAEQADALWERFKHYDPAIIYQALEAMTYDDTRLSLKSLREAVKSKILRKDPKPDPVINIDIWPETQKQRMRALTEAIGQGSAAVGQLKEDQIKGEGIWDLTAEKARDRYDCHENCDQGSVLYQCKDGSSYAGSCAICKRGPGKPAPLINPDNVQIIKWGCDRPPF